MKIDVNHFIGNKVTIVLLYILPLIHCTIKYIVIDTSSQDFQKSDVS